MVVLRFYQYCNNRSLSLSSYRYEVNQYDGTHQILIDQIPLFILIHESLNRIFFMEKKQEHQTFSFNFSNFQLKVNQKVVFKIFNAFQKTFQLSNLLIYLLSLLINQLDY